MKITPRDYQEDAAKAAVKEKENTLIVLSTGAGKSVVISELIKKSKAKKVLIFQPRAEILKQNVEHYEKIIGDDYSIMSASAGSHSSGKITFATIGTAANRTEEFIGTDLIIYDEAHNFNIEKKRGQYNKFLKAIKFQGKCIGLTATPFRNYRKFDVSSRQTKRTIDVLTEIGKPNSFWKSICYNVDISYLIEKGYLYKPEYRYFNDIDYSQLKLTADGSNYTKESLKQFDEQNVNNILDVAKIAYKEKNKIIVYVDTISAAEDLTKKLINEGINAGVVSSNETKEHNDSLLVEFKTTDKKMMIVNVNILTEGYDCKECDAVILGTPTASLNKYIQRAGRCIRPAGEKPPIVYDYAQSSKRFAPIEDILLMPTEEGSYKCCSRDGKELSGWQETYEMKDNLENNSRGRRTKREDNFDFVSFQKMTVTYIDEIKTSKKGNKYLRISVFIEDIEEDADFLIMEKHLFDSMDYSKKVEHAIKKDNTLRYVRCSFDSNSNFGFINDNVYFKR